MAEGHGSAPPVSADFTESPVPNDARDVRVRVTPFAGLPTGSFDARANRTRVSATSPFHADGTLTLSGFVAEKSLFRATIWLLI
jgi:hypothetical protein